MTPALADALRRLFGKNTRLVPKDAPAGRSRTKDTSIERAFEGALNRSPLRGKYVKQCGAVAPYHLDFGFPDVRLGVECDGEAWHGRTSGQARRDAERDTLLRAHGWIVLRFWGKDLLKDADECVAETLHVYKTLKG